jgi:hypothetical protein
MLDKLDREISTAVTFMPFCCKEIDDLLGNKNEDKIRGNIKASASSQWLLEALS